VNSKQKGSSFEREICRKLSLWVSEGNSDDLYWRSAMSGGRATVRTKKGQKTTHGQGDISSVTPEGSILTDNFVIECKNYNSIGFSNFLYNKGVLKEIWSKLLKESIESNKHPLLVIKENRKPVLVCFNRNIGFIPFLCKFKQGLVVYYFDDLIKFSIMELL